MRDHWVGPMPVDDFIDTFLPSPSEESPSPPMNHFSQVFAQSTESSAYDPFICAIKDWIPGFVAVNTGNKGEDLKTDVSIYRAGDNVPSRTDFSQIEMWIEFKRNKNGQPFQDAKESSDASGASSANASFDFISATSQGADTRGQLTSYAVAMHGCQFRHFSFSVFIAGDHARLFRWDHAGTIVSTAFNLCQRPEVMASFLWRFSHLSEADRGYDMSVRPANISEEMDKQVRDMLGLKDEKAMLFEYDLPGLMDKGRGYDPVPPMSYYSLASRATRNLPIYFIPTKTVQADNLSSDAGVGDTGPRDAAEGPWSHERVVYLKDTWRFLSDDPTAKVIPEHEIYAILYEQNTPNIPSLVAGGDVPGGMARTQAFLNSAWMSKKLRLTPYCHYRLVLGDVGRSLTTFRSTREMVQAVFDAMEAHWHAYNVAKILHRDVSPDNIIMTEDGRGLLIDWELAKSVTDSEARRPDRTGTWQFMSAALLLNGNKEHTLADDLESFVHVIGWLVLRFVPSTAKYLPAHRASDMEMFDKVDYTIKEESYGGKMKRGAFRAGTFPSESFEFKQATPLADLLNKLSEPFRSLYSIKPPTEEQRNKLNNPTNLDPAELRRLMFRISCYDEDMKTLQSSEWFIDKFQRALEQSNWPEDDGADKDVFKPSEDQFTELQQARRVMLLQAKMDLNVSSRALPSVNQDLKRSATSPPPAPTKRNRKDDNTPLTSTSQSNVDAP